MSNEWFRFKEFLVKQDQCAMKVGTDSVLIGAWCNIDKCSKVLDLGTGTGIIALMCAQRSKAAITGVEIDPLAAKQAKENFADSPWNDRLEIIQADIRTFLIPGPGFDLIVSNPPYFKKSILGKDNIRNIARHEGSLNLSDLVKFAVPLLNPQGKISLILPQDRFTEANGLLLKEGMYLSRKTEVSSKPGTNTIRILAEWSNFEKNPVYTRLNIYCEEYGQYHEDYDALTKNFYL